MSETREHPRYWSSNSDAQAAVALLQREDPWYLAGYEGCLCADFKIMAFQVEINCRKSSATKSGETRIVVSSRHMDVTPEDLTLVADEVSRHVMKQEPGTTLVVLTKKE